MSNKIQFRHITIHDKPEQSPGFLLWHVSTSWRNAIETISKTFNLTHPQFVVLATLGWLTKDGELVTQAVVGKMAGLDPNTMSQILRGLEVKKFIKRTPSVDSRAKNPMLTIKGSQVLVQALPAVEKADVLFFKELTEQETEIMLTVFQKLAGKE